MAYDFPNAPTVGQIYTPSGGPTWQWNGTTWQLMTMGPEAPLDGALYGRQSGNWAKAVKLAGDTMTGNLIIAPPTGFAFMRASSADSGSIIIVDKAAGNEAIFAGRHGNNSRWDLVLADSAADSAPNNGSNLKLRTYNNDGSPLHDVLLGLRSTGLLTVRADPTAALGIATKQYVDTKAPALPGVYKISSGVATSVATLDITLPSGYAAFEIVLGTLLPSANAVSFVAQLSSDGTTFSTAAQYNYGGNVSVATAAAANSPAGSGATGQSSFMICGSVGSASQSNLFVKIPAPTGGAAMVMWQGVYYNGTNWYYVDGGGLHQGMSSPPKAIRFLFSSGTVAQCQWQLNGYK